mmetsp:Transcript_22908/g.23853  ORF Transcript_22908/g.23853 Transcript_22908/m.23853 type:complete len:269 (+) Transcript_22908:151-957(+)
MEPETSPNQENTYENGNNSLNNDSKEKRKRRSKNDPEGRSHKCDICGKTYLSRPALSQHIKTKHQDRIGEYKRGRGRPRKCDTEITSNIQRDKYIEFFNRSICRIEEDGEKIDYKKALLSCVEDLYKEHPFTLKSEGKEAKDYPLLSLEIEGEKREGKPVYDEGILVYLIETAGKVNKKYFDFICKFCFLFRESFNLLKLKENPSLDKDYSSFNSAEEVPDKCNDFITDFMEVNNYFNLDCNEVIELIQHFCHWLYEKSYTTSVLSLI